LTTAFTAADSAPSDGGLRCVRARCCLPNCGPLPQNSQTCAMTYAPDVDCWTWVNFSQWERIRIWTTTRSGDGHGRACCGVYRISDLGRFHNDLLARDGIGAKKWQISCERSATSSTNASKSIRFNANLQILHVCHLVAVAERICFFSIRFLHARKDCSYRAYVERWIDPRQNVPSCRFSTSATPPVEMTKLWFMRRNSRSSATLRDDKSKIQSPSA